MKIILVTLLAITQLVNTGNAQENENTPPHLPFGIKLGTNYSNVYDEQGQSFNADAKSGLAAGVFFPISLGSFIGVQPELLFSQKGFKATGNLLGSSYNFKRTTNHLDIPLMVALKPMPALTLLAGPQFSYLLKQRDEWTSSTSSVAQEKEFENDNIRRNTLCLIGGADINVEHLVIGVRGGWDLSANHGDGTSSTLRYKNVWFQATVGYRF